MLLLVLLVLLLLLLLLLIPLLLLLLLLGPGVVTGCRSHQAVRHPLPPGFVGAGRGRPRGRPIQPSEPVAATPAATDLPRLDVSPRASATPAPKDPGGESQADGPSAIPGKRQL